MKKRTVFLMVGIILFSTLSLRAIDFSNITSISITAFATGNSPSPDGELKTNDGIIAERGNPSLAGQLILEGKNEPYFGYGFGGIFTMEFDKLLSVSAGLEYEETKVKYLETELGQIGLPSSSTVYHAIPRDLTHRYLQVPILLGYRINTGIIRVQLNAGPNIVYYLPGTEHFRHTDQVEARDPNPVNTTYELKGGETLLGLPLDVNLTADLKLGLPIDLLGGEFLLGIGYTYFFNSPNYEHVEAPAEGYYGTTPNRDYGFKFVPLKASVGFRFYLSGYESMSEASSTKTSSSSRGQARTTAKSYAW